MTEEKEKLPENPEWSGKRDFRNRWEAQTWRNAESAKGILAGLPFLTWFLPWNLETYIYLTRVLKGSKHFSEEAEMEEIIDIKWHPPKEAWWEIAAEILFLAFFWTLCLPLAIIIFCGKLFHRRVLHGQSYF